MAVEYCRSSLRMSVRAPICGGSRQMDLVYHMMPSLVGTAANQLCMASCVSLLPTRDFKSVRFQTSQLRPNAFIQIIQVYGMSNGNSSNAPVPMEGVEQAPNQPSSSTARKSKRKESSTVPPQNAQGDPVLKVWIMSLNRHVSTDVRRSRVEQTRR